VQVIDSMNVLERARALRDLHQAIILGNFVDAVSRRVRVALRNAGRALTLVLGRSGH